MIGLVLRNVLSTPCTNTVCRLGRIDLFQYSFEEPRMPRTVSLKILKTNSLYRWKDWTSHNPKSKTKKRSPQPALSSRPGVAAPPLPPSLNHSVEYSSSANLASQAHHSPPSSASYSPHQPSPTKSHSYTK